MILEPSGSGQRVSATAGRRRRFARALDIGTAIRVIRFFVHQIARTHRTVAQLTDGQFQ